MSTLKRLNVAMLMATIFTSNLLAQETPSKPENGDYTDKTFFYEQGLNCTQFVKQYLSLNATTNTNLPYLFTGNFVYKKIGLRYGFNFNNSRASTSQDPTGTNTAFNTPNTTKTLTNVYDARVGVFYYKRLSRRFITNIGVDFLYLNSYIKTSSFNSTSSGTFSSSTTNSDLKTVATGLGCGPFISIQYFIAPRVSIGTESAIYYSMSSSNQSGNSTSTITQTINTGSGFFTQTSSTSTTNKNSSKDSGTNLIVPLNLFVYFRF